MARGGVTDGVPWGSQIDELRKLGRWPQSNDQELITDAEGSHDMSNIDYEALTMAALSKRHDPRDGFWDSTVRAVVAALEEQGFVVVRADDLDHALDGAFCPGTYSSAGREAFQRLSRISAEYQHAALAAPDDEVS